MHQIYTCRQTLSRGESLRDKRLGEVNSMARWLILAVTALRWTLSATVNSTRKADLRAVKDCITPVSGSFEPTALRLAFEP